MRHLIAIVLLTSTSAYAELTPMDDASLSAIEGQNGNAIGLVWDDVYVTGKDAKLTLDFDSDIPLVFSDFYWIGHDSDRSGDNVYGGNVGSYNDPYFFNVQDDSVTLKDGTTLQNSTLIAAFPEGDYKTEAGNPDAGKMDLGMLMTLEHASGNTDETWLLFNGMDLDSTYLKLWAPDGGGLAMSGELNFHADELIFQTASVNGAPSDNLNTAWRINDFDLYVPLGNSLYQPVTLEADEDQQIVFEIAAINTNTAEQFYTEPTGHLTAGNIQINDWDSGRSYIDGIQIQHLRVQTHDLSK